MDGAPASCKGGIILFRVTDALGRLVYERGHVVHPGRNEVALPFHQLRNGPYIVTAALSPKSRVARVIKE